MRPKRRVQWAAWLPLPVVLVLIVVGVYYWRLAYAIDATPDSSGLIAVTGFAMVVFAVFGGLIASHRPRNPIGWIFCGAALLVATRGASFAYANWSMVAPSTTPGGPYVAWLSSWIWIPAIGSLGTFLLLVFPNGRLLSRRWRPAVWLSLTAVAAMVVSSGLRAGPFDDFAHITNPLAAPGWASGIVAIMGLGFSLLPLSVAVSLTSLVLRARRAGQVERQQIKWIGYAGAFLVVGIAYSFASENFGTLASLLLFGPLCAIPIAATIAIYRYRLFEIDRLITRTVSYAIITAFLGGIFVLVALGPAALAGAEDSPDWVIALATLLVIALFRPVRRRVQGAVDRRFNRARYDAEQTIDAFMTHLREEVDLDALGTELRSVVDRTMHPAHISLWIKQP